MTSADLSDAEIDRACQGFVQNAAKIRHLKRMGLLVRTKPNGRPLVNRRHYDEISSGGKNTVTNTEPNWGIPA